MKSHQNLPLIRLSLLNLVTSNMTGESTDISTEISSSEVLTALSSISESEWEAASWPAIAYVPRATYFRFDEDPNIDNRQDFWKTVLNSDNFLNPNTGDKYKPKEHMLFIVHSFSDRNGQESVFKAITTSPKSLIEDPGNMINYRHHGQPCEIRSKQIYPTLNFWEFYDNLSLVEQNKYAIPTKEVRKRSIKLGYLNK